MSLLTYTSLIKLMKQSTRFRKQSSGKSKDLKQIYKENIADKKLNIKDTPKNRIKLQTIIIKEFRKKEKKPITLNKPKTAKRIETGSLMKGKIIKKAIPIPKKDQVAVPDKINTKFNPVEKNLTAYGKSTDANEPDKVSKEALKRDWTIISDNCWGVAYNKAANELYNRKYRTPFAGIFFMAPDWITFLENFDEYIKIKPTIQPKVNEKDKYNGASRWKGGKKPWYNYTVLLLKGSKGDVEIHYAHEHTVPETALRKWTERLGRMTRDKNDMIVKMDDRDRFTAALGKRFLELKQFPHKLLFVHKRYKKQFKDFEGDKSLVLMDVPSSQRDGLQLEGLYPVPAKV